MTWLHLSDLHLCQPKNGPDRLRVLAALVDDLKKLRREQGLHPDLLFITGDLAYGNLGTGQRSLPSQYAEVQQFIRTIAGAYQPEIPPSRVFLVPGNHDVDREMATIALTRWVKEAKLGEIEDMLQTANRQWSQYVERLHSYREFLERYGYSHLLEDRDRLIYARQVRVNDLDVAVVGLNSAWSCSEKEEKAIWIGGRPQIDRLYPGFANAHIKIALLHHSTRWIHPDESPRLEQQLISDFDFCLHGHEHVMFLSVNVPPGHHRVAAGATYQGPVEENAYNIVRIEEADGAVRGRVWLRRYEHRRWAPKVIGPYTDDHGVWHLDGSLKPIAERISSAQPVRQDMSPRQAAAVCFQRETDKLRFLLKLTSKKRWIFPKARIMGQPPEAVAVHAADEEGGVIGKLREPMLTQFGYRRDDDPPIQMAAFLFDVEGPSARPAAGRNDATWYTMEEAMAALMEKRKPHEWWPLVLVLHQAWAQLEVV